MKKIIVIGFVVFLIILLFTVIMFEWILYPPVAQNILQVNIYLEDYDVNTFNESHIISITDKSEIKQIIEYMKLDKWSIKFYGNKEHVLAFNPSGYVEFVFCNQDTKRYEFFENKKGFYYQKSPDWFFYVVYENDSFYLLKELKDKRTGPLSYLSSSKLLEDD